MSMSARPSARMSKFMNDAPSGRASARPKMKNALSKLKGTKATLLVMNDLKETEADDSLENKIVSINKTGTSSLPGYIPSVPEKICYDCTWQMSIGEMGGIGTSESETKFYGLCDGHGPAGRDIAELISRRMQFHVKKDFNAVLDQSKKDEKKRDIGVSSQKDKSATEIVPTDILTRAHGKVLKDVYRSDSNIFFSGSTLLTCLIRGHLMYITNVGDSRLILARKEEAIWKPTQMTIDHRPENPQERARLEAAGARVEPFIMSKTGLAVGPLRVWLKTQNAPGLALSRSFGDAVANQIGVVADPDVFKVVLKKRDKFIVIACDTMFEFLSNEEVVSIVIPFYEEDNAEKAAEELTRQAQWHWEQNESTVSDMTCMVIFFRDVH